MNKPSYRGGGSGMRKITTVALATLLSVATAALTATTTLADNVWTYYASGDASNPHSGTNCIVKGDWGLKLSGALSANSTSAMLTGYLSGSGELDLRGVSIVGSDGTTKYSKITTIAIGSTWQNEVFRNTDKMTAFYADNASFGGVPGGSIPLRCFMNCSNLTTFAVQCAPNSKVTEIFNRSFYGTPKLTSFSLTDSKGAEMVISFYSGSSADGHNQFNRSGFKEIPSSLRGVSALAGWAFAYCPLENVVMTNLTSGLAYPRGVFQYCAALTNAYLGGTYAEVGTGGDANAPSLFMGCTNMWIKGTAVLDSPNLTKIGSYFGLANNIVIGATNAVTSLSSGLFNNASYPPASVTFYGLPPTQTVLDTALAGRAATNKLVIYASKRYGESAWRKAAFCDKALTEEEQAAAPEGCFGVYVTAAGARKAWLVHKASPYDDEQKGLLLIIR